MFILLLNLTMIQGGEIGLIWIDLMDEKFPTLFAVFSVKTLTSKNALLTILIYQVANW